MTLGHFRSGTVRRVGDGRSLRVDGLLVDGTIEPDMALYVPFNPTLGVAMRISEVRRRRDGRLNSIIDCEEEEDGVELMEDLNFGDELLEIVSRDARPPGPAS